MTTHSTSIEQSGKPIRPFYHVRDETPPATPPPATPPPVTPPDIEVDAGQLQAMVRGYVEEHLQAQPSRTPPTPAIGVHTNRRPTPQGFSIVKAIGCMVNKYNTRTAAFELDLLSKYSAALIESGWKPAGDATGFAFPTAGHLHSEDIRPLAFEIRSAMAAYTEQVDPDELYKLRSSLPAWYSRDLSPLNDLTGGSLIPLAQQGDMIELLRAKAVVTRAGAVMVPMPMNGSVRYPKQASAGTAYRVGVQQTITESTPGTGWLTLSAKKLGAIYDMPNEFFRFASPGIETFVRQDLMKTIALKMDQDCLEGAADGLGVKGLVNYPTSVKDTTTANKIQLVEATTAGADGDTVAYADGDKLLTFLEEANANSESATFIMRPAKRRHIFGKRADAVSAADSAGPFLGIPTIGQRPRTWYEQPVLPTTQITNNRAKGSGIDLTYIVAGDWTDYLLAVMGALEITFNPYDSTLFQQDATRVRAIQQVDGAPRHEHSFALMDFLLPTS